MKKGNCTYTGSSFMCINIKLSHFCHDIFTIMFYCCIVNIYVMIFYTPVLWAVHLFGICIIIFIIAKHVSVNEHVITIEQTFGQFSPIDQCQLFGEIPIFLLYLLNMADLWWCMLINKIYWFCLQKILSMLKKDVCALISFQSWY